MRPSFALVAAGLLGCLVHAPLLAQSKQPKPPDRASSVQATTAAPRLTRQLPPAKQLQLLNEARAAVQLPAVSAAPASTTRISVGAARSPAGAHIVLARMSLLGGPSQENQDGYLAMKAAGPHGGGDFVELSFPAQGGRLYLLDCTVRTEGGARPVQFFRTLGGEMVETAVGVDDHVMVVVRAEGPVVRRVLQSPAANWWWQACDIAPIS